MESFSENKAIEKISIITVVYNDDKVLEKTIKSVLDQNYANLEYIIIDGGSTDNSIEIIKKYEDRIAFWSSEPDKGIYDAMNKGMQKVTGDWFNFMNTGDVFNPNSLKEFATEFDDQYSVVYADLFLINEDKSITKSAQSGLFRMGYFLDQMAHQSIFFNTKKCTSIPYDLNFKVAADLDLLVKLYFKFGKESFHHINQHLVHYELGGFSAQNYSTLVKERYQIISKLPIGLRYINKLNFYRQSVLKSRKS